MKDYLLFYEGGDPNWRNRPADQQRAVMAQWGEWFKELETSGHLRNPGAPLDRGGVVVRRNGDSITTDRALPEVKELIGGFSIIAAESIEQATELAKGSPFLTNNPGGSVVVRPVIQMQG